MHGPFILLCAAIFYLAYGSLIYIEVSKTHSYLALLSPYTWGPLVLGTTLVVTFYLLHSDWP